MDRILDLERNLLEAFANNSNKLPVDTEINATIDPAGLATGAKQDTAQATLAEIAGRVSRPGMMILASGQLKTGTGGVYAAEAGAMLVLPTADDTFIVKSATVTETYKFVASKAVDFDVEIAAGDISTTLTNLLAEIWAQSAIVSGAKTSGLDAYFGVATSNQFYLWAKSTAAGALRCYGTLTAAAGIKVVKFGYNNDADYSLGCSSVGNLPATDPAVRQFGPERATVLDGEQHHSVSDGIVFVWDASSTRWMQDTQATTDFATQTTLAALLAALQLADFPTLGTPVVLAISETSARTAALTAGKYLIWSEVACGWRQGAGDQTAVLATDNPLAAGTAFPVTLAAQKLAAITAGASGNLYIVAVS